MENNKEHVNKYVHKGLNKYVLVELLNNLLLKDEQNLINPQLINPQLINPQLIDGSQVSRGHVFHLLRAHPLFNQITASEVANAKYIIQERSGTWHKDQKTRMINWMKNKMDKKEMIKINQHVYVPKYPHDPCHFPVFKILERNIERMDKEGNVYDNNGTCWRLNTIGRWQNGRDFISWIN
jgi:hypothetical protein